MKKNIFRQFIYLLFDIKLECVGNGRGIKRCIILKKITGSHTKTEKSKPKYPMIKCCMNVDIEWMQQQKRFHAPSRVSALFFVLLFFLKKRKAGRPCHRPLFCSTPLRVQSFIEKTFFFVSDCRKKKKGKIYFQMFSILKPQRERYF